MKTRDLLIALSLLLLSACGKKQAVKAIIYERKFLPQNRLLISYRYTVDNVSFQDSATVANRILPGDTITVIVDSRNPGKALPELSFKN